jgi:hypothetical protein
MTEEDSGVNTHTLTQVPAHRVVLAARSEYFRALFDGDMSDSKAPSVSLTTLSQEVALVSRAARLQWNRCPDLDFADKHESS